MKSKEKNAYFWYKRSAFQMVWRSGGRLSTTLVVTISGNIFCTLFSSVVYFSHRRSARKKNQLHQKEILPSPHQKKLVPQKSSFYLPSKKTKFRTHPQWKIQQELTFSENKFTPCFAWSCDLSLLLEEKFSPNFPVIQNKMKTSCGWTVPSSAQLELATH